MHHLDQLDQFTCGGHSFFIAAAESCMIRTVTLFVTVECASGTKASPCEIKIYEITEGDHVWNTLVADREVDGILDLAPCCPYLRFRAEEFAREHPSPLSFGSEKKAHRFSQDIMRRPLNVRGSPYPVPYPGSGSE